jgi:hypothetical protein
VSFLSPLLLLGLGAIVVPILVHLIQRERKHVVEFPSLMFIQKIPYQSVRRRRIRHWFLLALRALAIALIVAAFARPFFSRGAVAAAAASGGREIVILLDQSASMGYGDHWAQAQAAARKAVDSLGSGDRGSLVLFGRNAEEHVRSTSDRGRLDSAIEAAKVTSGATRYGPALKLAEGILTRSNMPRREAIVISDFQQTGWSGAEDVKFGENVTITPVSVRSDTMGNVAVPSVAFARAPFSGQERVTMTAGVANKAVEPVSNVSVTLEIDGRQMESKTVSIGPNASASVSFAAFTLAAPGVSGVVRAGDDRMPSDNALHFVLTPLQPVSVALVDGSDRGTASFYLSKALEIGTTPSFQVETVPVARASSDTIAKRNVVILNNTMLPPGLGADSLRRFVEEGGGLLVVFGDRTAWPANDTVLFPGKVGQVIDRGGGRGGSIGFIDYSHQALEVFKAPRSGDFSAASILRYRLIEPAPTDRVLARFDDNNPAIVERRVGNGRVIAVASSLDDSWNNVALKPVYLPLVHQIVRYLARYEPPAPWRTVGQVVDLSDALRGRAERLVVTPANEQIKVPATEAGIIELNEHGVYQVRAASSSATVDRIAVNIDPAESDLAPLDPQEMIAAVSGRAGPSQTGDAIPTELTAAESERQQGLWWYLLAAGLLLLAAETAIANHLSRNERFL